MILHRIAFVLLPAWFVTSIAGATLPPGIDLTVDDDRAAGTVVAQVHPPAWDKSASAVVTRGTQEGGYYATLRRVDEGGRVFVVYDITRFDRRGDLRLIYLRDFLSAHGAADEAKLKEVTAQLPDRVSGRVEVPRGQRTSVARGTWADGVHYAFSADVL